MNYRVALSFEDGVTRFVTCAADQTVADASYRQRINIPLDCRDGACGTCKAYCESGDYDGGNYIEDALTAEEAAAGYVLPCSMRPKSDLVVRIASTSAVAKAQAATYSGTVTALHRLSPTTVGLTVEIPDREALAYLPGQYVNIAVPGTGQSRSYSFSNAPGDKELTFLVKLTSGGVMSTYLTDRAAVGDALTFTGPNGSFFLRESERPVLLLAGGTGLAPVLSILRSLRASGSTRPAHLIYGVSTDDDLVELATIAELADDLDDFTWDYCVSDPGSAAPNKGYVTELIRDRHLYGGDVAVYLCGPPPMVEAVRKHVAELGVEPTGFYYEKFALSGKVGQAGPADNGIGGTDGSAPDVPVASRGGADVPTVGLPQGTTDAVEGVVLMQSQARSGQQAASSAGPSAVVAPGEHGAADSATVGKQGSVVAQHSSVLTEPAATGGEGRSVSGQAIFPAADTAALGSTNVPSDDGDSRYSIAGQRMWPGDGGATDGIDLDDQVIPDAAARGIAGQSMLPPVELEPLFAATRGIGEAAGALTPDAPADGYEIGEEHPSIHESDAVFEAREALELGALEITIGRLGSQQLAGYRLLAESTLPYVDGDRFLDAAAYTETNAAFHDYLFAQTGKAHLLAAYRALGVQARMEETLRNARWCHPRCARDHIEIVAAFEAGDRQAARQLIIDHAERSKQTMRRAMADAEEAKRPRFISPGRFDGKVVVVTGAAQGIGERAARRMAAEGGSVVLVDRSELVTEVAGDLVRDGATAVAVTADLENWEDAQEMITAAVRRFGRIDVLINNVGGAIAFKPFVEFSAADIQAEITRSLMTTLWSCRAALPAMVERGHGVVVNVSSVATRGIHRIPYSAAKGGINALTASLAMEYADAGIRVVATAPGGTEAPPRRISRGGRAPQTDQEQAWFQAHIDQTLESSLLHRYGTLDEQAAAIAFLASDEAGYITGTVLPVGGGDLG